MKFIAIVAVLGLACLCASMPSHHSSEELSPEIEKKRDECIKELGVKESDMKNDEPHVKLQACVLKKSGLVTPDNKFSKEGFIAGEKMASGNNQDAVERAMKIAEECEKEVGTGTMTEEDVTKKVVKCLQGTHDRDHSPKTM